MCSAQFARSSSLIESAKKLGKSPFHPGYLSAEKWLIASLIDTPSSPFPIAVDRLSFLILPAWLRAREKARWEPVPPKCRTILREERDDGKVRELVSLVHLLCELFLDGESERESGRTWESQTRMEIHLLAIKVLALQYRTVYHSISPNRKHEERKHDLGYFHLQKRMEQNLKEPLE